MHQNSVNLLLIQTLYIIVSKHSRQFSLFFYNQIRFYGTSISLHTDVIEMETLSTFKKI